MDNKNYDYDIAFSFAGEQRSAVRELSDILSKRSIKVFYDEYEQANLWGKDLYQYLQTIYRDKAKFCIVCISKDYARKMWTRHELEQAQARAFKDSKEYVLPLRFDNTQIPGINDTTGYIDYHNFKPDKIVDMILDKLKADYENKSTSNNRDEDSITLIRENIYNTDFRIGFNRHRI